VIPPQGNGPIAGLTSIIVPCWNQREFTQPCLQARFRHTRPALELIVVDNGSTDATAAYLAGVQDGSRVPVTVITNACDPGFPAAINQGLQVASGEYLVLLNNDAVVTDGWLDHRIALTRVSTAESRRPPQGTQRSPRRRSRQGRSGRLAPWPPLRQAGKGTGPARIQRGSDRSAGTTRLTGGSAWSGRWRMMPRRRNGSRVSLTATWRLTGYDGEVG
jgi:glycosyltransferase involved in cell wall biosynthesis